MYKIVLYGSILVATALFLTLNINIRVICNHLEEIITLLGAAEAL